ncbi:hypothetical protein SAMN04489765_3123 [Tsukamurella pulmonis]|uniref:Uncharacterized protein n=1 Tax=Tsukamurella pulmonis TaxID=47312 RepID=A0A1H1G5F9_9ACTN|nr:hypothetical protein [Tsukamurella pulmonis]SDR08464.1 hypothetical protein SAMN04489765_3123 [Tsukamurella pulmonis]SUP17836.1 Uncharacterised protein [Tsukamurella pulmonis]
MSGMTCPIQKEAQMRGWKLAGVGVAVGATILAGCGGGADRASAEAVAAKCKNSDSFPTLSEDKKSIDFNLYSRSQGAEDAFNCILKETGAPSSVSSKVKQTRPIDGTQTTKWDGWELSWSYSGSGPMKLIFEQV